MTPTQFKSYRERLNLSQSDTADLLGLEGPNGARTVRRWEAGDTAIPGSAGLLLTMIVEAITTYRLRLADYGKPGEVVLAGKPPGIERQATEAVAALLRKAGVKVEILDH